MHATMAIFNAWCDRMPMVILGATGRSMRSTAGRGSTGSTPPRDQGALVRGYTKWDDQPASPAAAREAILRAGWIANTAPAGRLTSTSTPACRRRSSPSRCRRSTRALMPAVQARRRADAIAEGRAAAARRQAPVILAGRVSRDPTPGTRASRWPKRSMRASSPTQGRRRLPHRPSAACRRAPASAATGAAAKRRKADVILSLDWVDVGGMLKPSAARRGEGHPGLGRSPPAQRLEHGLSGTAAGRRHASPASRMSRCRRCSRRSAPAKPHLVQRAAAPNRSSPPARQAHRRSSSRCAAPRGRRAAGHPSAHVSLSWHGGSWPFRHPLDYLGGDGGGGIGGGPGISVGAALALKGSGRLPVGVCGDGDFLMASDCPVDRGALQDSAADRGRQQPLVLQRRAASGARRAHAQPSGREQAGSASASPSPISISRRSPAPKGRTASARSTPSPISVRHSPRLSPRSRRAASPSSTCASSRVTPPP